VGKTKRGKGTKLMAIADRHGLPVAVRTESASPAENTLVAATLEGRLIAEVPERLIGDKAYDSDGLDAELMEAFGTEMIAPHRRGRRTDTKTQDGRSLRRFKRRWKVERFFAWLSNFRRLVVRWEYHAENFQGFVHLGCLILLLRHL
jgi:transposase